MVGLKHVPSFKVTLIGPTILSRSEGTLTSVTTPYETAKVALALRIWKARRVRRCLVYNFWGYGMYLFELAFGHWLFSPVERHDL